MRSGDRERIAERQFMEFSVDGGRLHAFGLVDHQPYFASRLAQLLGDDAVLWRQAMPPVDQQHDSIGFIDREQRLLRHRVQYSVMRDRLEAAGVDHDIRLVADAATSIVAVACQTGYVGNERVATASEPVEQRRLADVRPADYDDGWNHSCAEDSCDY